MRKRSSVIVALGLAVFVVGAAATWFVLRDKDTSEAAPAGPASTVLYATQAIPAGTTGANALNGGLVKTKSVSASATPPGALTDPSQLVGKTAASAVPAGSVLTTTSFPQPQTGIGTLKIPEGKTALALSMGYPPGVAGYAQAGDKVDIFGVIHDVPCGCILEKTVGLVMQNTEVLSVSAPAVAAGQIGGPDPVFLLAVTPLEAERLVYLTSFQKLYFSLVPRDQGAVPGTPGSNIGNTLELLP